MSKTAPSKHSSQYDGSALQAKPARKAVEHAKSVTEQQRTVLDKLGKARAAVDGAQAVLATVGEVSQSYATGADFAYGLISYILL